MKALPWKVGELGERKSGVNGKKTYARSLFITRPKEKQGHQVQDQVMKVAERIDKWELGDRGVGVRKRRVMEAWWMGM